MIIEAGTHLRMNGFDCVDDGAQVKEACIPYIVVYVQ